MTCTSIDVLVPVDADAFIQRQGGWRSDGSSGNDGFVFLPIDFDDNRNRRGQKAAASANGETVCQAEITQGVQILGGGGVCKPDNVFPGNAQVRGANTRCCSGARLVGVEKGRAADRGGTGDDFL